MGMNMCRGLSGVEGVFGFYFIFFFVFCNVNKLYFICIVLMGNNILNLFYYLLIL